ncbi:DUF4283 domain-containing protein [Raphanus sativus]|nr:DUF4283 domain-containing protein [Raphanus sativus]
MASSDDVPLVPPWPPDALVSSGIPPSFVRWYEDSSVSLLFPEVSPSPAVLTSPSGLPPPPSPSIKAADPSISPSSALWVSKLKSSAHNLKKLATPSFAQDGTPIVKAPDSVVFHSSTAWKGYLVAQFHGDPPSPAKIFSDLNPIWGKNGRIKVTYHSKRVCFIFIPCEVTRQWVLDVGFWHSGHCAFSVLEWSPNLKITPMKLEYAPVWVRFRNVPPELWSFEGFSTCASGVGFPVQSEFAKLPPYSTGVVKLRVIVKLEAKRAPSVRVVDKLGNAVTVFAEYLRLPHKCKSCLEFGHSEFRCPLSSEMPIRKSHQALGSYLPPPLVDQKSTSKSASSVRSKRSPSGNLNSLPADPSNHPTPPGKDPLLGKGIFIERSASLPSPSVQSEKSVNTSVEEGWTRAGQKPSPPKDLPKKAETEKSIVPVPSAQSESEEALINEAQRVMRNRLAAAEADVPPFSTARDRKRYRKKQRQLIKKEIAKEAGGTASSSGQVPSVPAISAQETSLVGLPVDGQSPPMV